MSPELINATLTFLNRVDLKGKEAYTLVVIQQTLQGMLPKEDVSQDTESKPDRKASK